MKQNSLVSKEALSPLPPWAIYDSKSAQLTVLIQVKPGAKKNALTGEHNGRVKIAVHAVPEQGKANIALLEFFADILDVPLSSITLDSGNSSKLKRVSFHHLHDPLSLVEKIVLKMYR